MQKVSELLNVKASFRLAMRGKSRRLSALAAGLLLAGLCAACGYRYYAGPLQPLPDAQQHTGMKVSDDGTVLFVQERFEVGVRPQTDAELNRLYPTYSKGGMESINPYTYGDWKDPETGSTPQRFTIFLLKVKNYSYPKVQIDPLKVSLIAANGREYSALDPLEFDEYYRPYATAYSGNLYDHYEERKDLFASSRYASEPVFSGQEAEGFLVFPALHPDVQELRLKLEDVAIRFDFRGDPIEVLDLEYLFFREIGRIYPDGTTRMSAG